MNDILSYGKGFVKGETKKTDLTRMELLTKCKFFGKWDIFEKKSKKGIAIWKWL